jgi:hypothetical protein
MLPHPFPLAAVPYPPEPSLLPQATQKQPSFRCWAGNYPLVEGSVAEHGSESLRQQFSASSIHLQSHVQHHSSTLTTLKLKFGFTQDDEGLRP